jgi:hypothetical protein
VIVQITLTHTRALLRMSHEAEKQPEKVSKMHYDSIYHSDISQLVWFLAPKVALATQQHDAIKSQLPHLRTRLLVGNDKIELWSERAVWDSILDNVAVVVSTYAILRDALSHGFVNIDRLSLLVFDEGNPQSPGGSIFMLTYLTLIAHREDILQTRSCKPSTTREGKTQHAVLLLCRAFWV